MTERTVRGKTPISNRYLLYYAATYIVLIGLLGFFVDRSARDSLVSASEETVETAARLAARDLPATPDPDALEVWASEVFSTSGLRATLIDRDGVVRAESHSDPAVMENHAGRPEVVAALSGDVGVARRVSVSTGFEQLYVALPPDGEGLIVRLSTPIRVVDERMNSLRLSIIVAALAAGLVGVGAVAWIARRTARPLAELTEQSLALSRGSLEITPRRSPIRELDQLGQAISEVATEQRARLAELSQAGQTLEVVLGAIPQGTVLIGERDEVVYANPSSRELLGEIPEALGGLVPLAFQRGVRQARGTGEKVIVDVDHGRPTVRLRGVATPFLEDDRVLLVIVDITERERTDSIKRDFAANASHELKTPVTTIIAASEALQIALARGDDSASTFARRIEASARQLDSLVGDLLDLSRLERSAPEAAPVRFDLLLTDEVVRVREKAQGREINLDVDDSVVVRASHRDLSIATRNLLDNAVRYTDEGDSIGVSLFEEDGTAVLSVSDEGEGIPSRDLGRIFERFYRVDSARSRATGGTGLGLAIVKHVAESHGGSVGVDSELGVGSTFTMRIPLTGSGEAEGPN